MDSNFKETLKLMKEEQERYRLMINNSTRATLSPKRGTSESYLESKPPLNLGGKHMRTSRNKSIAGESSGSNNDRFSNYESFASQQLPTGKHTSLNEEQNLNAIAEEEMKHDAD